MIRTITLSLACAYTTAARASPRVCQVAGMFGLGVDESRTMEVVPRMALTLSSGRLIFITGASGGGKTTLLRLIGEALEPRDDARVITFNPRDDSVAADVPIIEAIGGTLAQATRWLSLAGLNDAFVMLRKQNELSDGQRYRFALAGAMAAVEHATDERLAVVLADEFGSTLDRLTAQIIARNVRRWTRRTGACFIAATTHDDLLESLEPDELIVRGG